MWKYYSQKWKLELTAEISDSSDPLNVTVRICKVKGACVQSSSENRLPDKATSIFSSTKTGLLFFFLQRGSKLKHQGSPYFQFPCCSQVSGGHKHKCFWDPDKQTAQCPQGRKPKHRLSISWRGPKSTPTKQKSSGLIWKRLPAAQCKPCNSNTQGYASRWAWKHRR